MTSWLRRFRIRSLSTPFGGAGMEVIPDRDKVAVERLFTFLEGRSAMHASLDDEYEGVVFASLQEIRRQADAALQAMERGSRAYGLVERFRDACVDFFREVPSPITDPFDQISPPYRTALVGFRKKVGPILGALEGATGVQVRSGLKTLPRYFQLDPDS